jgi:hypothetical protein
MEAERGDRDDSRGEHQRAGVQACGELHGTTTSLGPLPRLPSSDQAVRKWRLPAGLDGAEPLRMVVRKYRNFKCFFANKKSTAGLMSCQVSTT